MTPRRLCLFLLCYIDWIVGDLLKLVLCVVHLSDQTIFRHYHGGDQIEGDNVLWVSLESLPHLLRVSKHARGDRDEVPRNEQSSVGRNQRAIVQHYLE